jgi:hypothetical protein
MSALCNFRDDDDDDDYDDDDDVMMMMMRIPDFSGSSAAATRISLVRWALPPRY